MRTRLVEIIDDIESGEESWADWATRNVKDNGWKVAGAAVVVAPVIPVAVGAVAVGAGLVSGVQNGLAWLRGEDTIEKIEIKNAAMLSDEHGKPVQIDQIYAIHPDEARSNQVIVASEFHNIVIREQITDLVLYIRGAVRAMSIRIEVASERRGKFGSDIFSKFTASAEIGDAKNHSVDLRYDDPEIVCVEETPFWMCIFPEIVAAFRGASKGSVTRNVSVDTTFGLNASLAEQAGIDANWLGKQRFLVEVKFC